MALPSSRGTVTFLCVFAISVMSGNAVDVTFKESACNGRGIEQRGDYARAINYALDDPVVHAKDGGYDYHGWGRFDSRVAFAHSKCNGEIGQDECEHCERVAREYLIQGCAFHTEGWVQLADCFISWWEFKNA